MSVTNPEVSIIVPVYKVERYLNECLDSIINQTFTDWECILIDDGSPDNSGKICDEYASKDTRFQVIHRNNGGLSAARNTGLSVSRGRFISFIDSDDIVHPEFLSNLYNLITSYKADMAQVSYESMFSTFTRKKHLVDEITVLNRSEVMSRLLTGKSMPNYLCIKLFKKDIIDSPLPENMAFEDIFVMGQWVKNIHKMVLSPEILYTYRRRGSSIVNTNFAKNRLDFIKATFSVAETLRTIEPEILMPELIDRYLWKGMVASGKKIARYEPNREIRNSAINKVSAIGRNVGVPQLKTLGLKIWFRASLLTHHPRVFSMLMRFLNKIDIHARYTRNQQFH